MVPSSKRYVPFILSLLLSIWVAFFLFDDGQRRFWWLALSLGAIFLSIVIASELLIKTATSPQLLRGLLLAAGSLVIIANLILAQQLPSLKRIYSSNLHEFQIFNSKREDINLLAGSYEYFHQVTLIAHPEQLALSGLRMERLALYRIADQVHLAPAHITLTDAQAKRLLVLPHISLSRRNGGNFYVIQPRPRKTYYLASYKDDWFFVPGEWSYQEFQQGK